MPTGVSLPVRDLFRTLRSVSKARPAGGLWLTGDPAAIADARAALGAGARDAGEAANADEASLHVYAGDDLTALAAAVRLARPKPLAALLPEALELAAWRVPGVSGTATSVDELPALVASLLPPEAGALVSGLPAVQGPFLSRSIARTSRGAALAGWRAADQEAAGAAVVLLEARLILQIAAATGQQVDQSRLPDLVAGAVAGGQLRQLAARVATSRTGRALAAAGTAQAVGRAALVRYARASSPESTERSTG
jgi:hypothetical protein